MHILIGIIAVLCLAGLAFGANAARAIAGLIFVGGAGVAIFIVGAVILQLMGHPI